MYNNSCKQCTVSLHFVANLEYHDLQPRLNSAASYCSNKFLASIFFLRDEPLTTIVSFSFFSNKTADLVADALRFMYTPWPDNNDKYALRAQLVDLFGDEIFFAPSHEVADIHSKYAPCVHVRVCSSS